MNIYITRLITHNRETVFRINDDYRGYKCFAVVSSVHAGLSYHSQLLYLLFVVLQKYIIFYSFWDHKMVNMIFTLFRFLRQQSQETLSLVLVLHPQLLCHLCPYSLWLLLPQIMTHSIKAASLIWNSFLNRVFPTLCSFFCMVKPPTTKSVSLPSFEKYQVGNTHLYIFFLNVDGFSYHCLTKCRRRIETIPSFSR